MDYRRNEILDRLIDALKDNASAAIPQHIIVSGDACSGKSWFLKVLSDRLASKNIESTILSGPYSSLSEASFLIEYAKINNKRVILFDDFDTYLSRLSVRQQYVLREFMFSPQCPAIVGTVTGVLKEMYDYQLPFYQAFRVFRLNVPDASYFNDMASTITGSDTFTYDEINSALGTNLHYWNRYLKLRKDANYSHENAVELIIEENQRYYNLLVNDLPYMQQVTIMGIAKNGNLAKATDIQSLSAASLPAISMSLNRLEKKNIIEKIGKGKRNIPYSISDKLFYRWLLKSDVLKIRDKQCDRLQPSQALI